MPQAGLDIAKWGLVAAALSLVLFAAFLDIRRFVIPNWISLSVLALGLIYVVVADAPHWTGHGLAALLVFAVGVVLFALRLLGGGDVKLMTAISLWSGFDFLMGFSVVTALAGGALSLFYLVRAIRGHKADGVGAVLKARIPYGVAIAAGGVYVFISITGHLG